MRNWITSFLFHIIFNKEDEYMMAMLWAQQIMLVKKTFAQVPAKLKEKVRELLVDSDMEELCNE